MADPNDRVISIDRTKPAGQQFTDSVRTELAHLSPIVIETSSVTLTGAHMGCLLRIPSGGEVILPTNASDASVVVGSSVTLFAEGADGLTINAASVTVLGAAPFLNVAQNGIAWAYKAATNNWIVIGGTS